MSPIDNMHLIDRRVPWDNCAIRQPGKTARMIVTVFRSTLMPGLRDDYMKEVEKLAAIAKTMPGYISHKGFFAEDGERCTIVEFENEEGMRAWAMNPDHRSAKKKARETYYASYSVQICDLKRESKFDRKAKGHAAE